MTLLTDESKSWHWYAWGIWIAGMVVKMGIATNVSITLSKKMTLFAVKQRMEKTRTFLDGTSRMGMTSWLVPDWLQRAMFGAPLYIDLDLDMATAINAILLSTANTREHWVKSWQKVPFLGEYIADLGLPFTMTILVVLATVMQMYFSWTALTESQKRVVKWPKASDRSANAWKERFLLWQHVGALSDVSSNVLLGEMCQCVCIDFCEPWEEAEKAAGKTKPHKHPGRGAKFTAKIVYEAAPQMWLQVSFVAHAYGTAHVRAIIIGAATILAGLCTMFGEIKRNFRRMIDLWGEIKGKTYEVFRMAVVLFIAVACTIRAAGIWFCDDHVFNLTGGCIEMRE